MPVKFAMSQNRIAAVACFGLAALVAVLLWVSSCRTADALRDAERDQKASAVVKQEAEARARIESARRRDVEASKARDLVESSNRAPQEPANRTEAAPHQPTVREGRLDGRDRDAGIVVESINLWKTATREGVAGRAGHGENVEVLECRSDLQPVMYLVKTSSCTGWVSQLFLKGISPF